MEVNKELLKQKIYAPNYKTRTFNLRTDQIESLKLIASNTNVPISKYLRACIDTIIELYETNQL